MSDALRKAMYIKYIGEELFMTKVLSPSEYKRQHEYFVVRPAASNLNKNGSIGIKMLSADDTAVDKRIAECNQLKAVNSWHPVTGFN